MKSFSIIIVNYNTQSLILSCLRFIYQQDEYVDEVIVVDNHSTDGSQEAIRHEFPTVKLIENSRNEGYARAVNKGLTRCRGKLVLVLNSDVELRPDALKNSIDFMQRHPDAGIAGCKLLNPDGSLQPSCEGFPGLWNVTCESFFFDRLFPRSRLFDGLHLKRFSYDRVAKVDRVIGAFLLVNRQALEEIGLMDEQFFFYSEEVDWCYRARRKDWAVYFFPQTEVIHHWGGSADMVSPALFVERHKNRYMFYRKYHALLPSLAMRGIAAVGVLLRLLLWSGIALYRGLSRHSGQAASFKKVQAYAATFRWYVGLWPARAQRSALDGEME